MSENPYDPPKVETENVRKSKSPSGLIWIVTSTIFGVLFGALFLWPFFILPGDPTGQSIAGGVCGFIGFGGGLLLRTLATRKAATKS
jgi:hypothetical protein